MEGGNNNNNNSKREKEEIVDVRSVVEAVSANDADIAPLYQLESLCMRCHQNGITRFLLTLIPHFRKILLSAFECPHCGERNNEVQFAGEIQPRGCCYRLEVPSGDPKMLNRQVVKSESATIKIPELDFEIPPEAQRGSLSTVEGILVRAADELQALQEERKKVDPQTAEALDQFLLKLKACATGDSSFTFILDDPAGNSFIENLYAPSPDPSLSIKFYERTPDQQATLGYSVDPSQLGDHREGTSMEQISGASDEVRREPHGSVGATAAHRAIAQSNTAEIVDTVFRYTAPEEVMTFPSTCGTCGIACETRMFVTKIPYFQEVIVMASTCDACGYRNSELKPGGRVPEKGKRISLTVRNNKDLSRDVIKSDTAGVKVPELDLELASGTLGGVVTTVEGLITKISESLERVHGFTFGDSLDNHKRSKWEDFKARLDKLLSLEEPWTLILDDALANSFIAPVTEDFKDDHQLTFEEYERSWEQNEELGLNDIDTSSADGAYHSTDTTMQVKTEVTWDEPEVLHNAKRVSPWQVEVLSPTAPVHTALTPTKKFRTPQSSGQLTDGEGDLFFPFSGYTNSTMGHMSQTLLNYNTFPASMQGARQNLFSKSSLSNFISENNMCIDNSFGNNTVPKLKSVSTELNIGSSQSENLSPDSQSSMHSPFGTEFVGTQYCSSPKVGTGSFQLFGKIIHTNQPVESGFDDIGCAEDDGSKGYNETDDVNNPLDHSLNYTKLLDRLDVQCQRASAVGACNL